MDNPMLVIEAPNLDDETAVKVFGFLQRLADTFEANYYTQMERYYRKYNNLHYAHSSNEHINEASGDQRGFDDEIPF
ncbi:MAG: hypothetical protein A3E82_01125 [Gammaproteobacteria bacterium RIFCSPHIGHO2_12_FULL_38_11]|nr:MAG: hypothetical protein A3E82_01125 [Gammaproteobacteria bacterium RIFCSPHIGHO2_12_FULL_38_11]